MSFCSTNWTFPLFPRRFFFFPFFSFPFNFHSSPVKIRNEGWIYARARQFAEKTTFDKKISLLFSIPRGYFLIQFYFFYFFLFFFNPGTRTRLKPNPIQFSPSKIGNFLFRYFFRDIEQFLHVTWQKVYVSIFLSALRSHCRREITVKSPTNILGSNRTRQKFDKMDETMI